MVYGQITKNQDLWWINIRIVGISIQNTTTARKKMKKQVQPLAEVFGYLVSDQSINANRFRLRRLCPFNNKVPNCTKDKAKNPLGVCSVFHDGVPAITCPIRFREDWLITDDAASFFFPERSTWSSLTEVRLNDVNGKTGVKPKVS